MNHQHCTDSTLHEMLLLQARSAYPKECAGLVLRDHLGHLSIVPCPDTHTSSTHFDLPASLFWSTRQHRQAIVAFYHSHPNGTADLSARDRSYMSVGREPLWPGVDWFVIPIASQSSQAPIRYRWSEKEGKHLPVGVNECN